MKIIRSIAQMQQFSLSLKNKKNIAVVPTMGFLHEGHLSLVRLAQKKADVVVVTIFVNPTQFGPNEDFERYPRDEKGDLAKLRGLGVDVVFMPPKKQMYGLDYQTTVTVDRLSIPLCGKTRPGHFAGVATVVCKLFHVVQPEVAVFGLKDYQQFLVIRQMTADLNHPIKIIGAPIVRESDGLAMSSRNAYLSPTHRLLARSLSQGLKAVKQVCSKGLKDINKIQKVFREWIPRRPDVKIDYCTLLDSKTLTPIKKYQKNKTLLAVAVWFGKTRLIDNMVM